MRARIGAGENSEPENVGDDERWLARAVHTEVGELVGGKALRVKSAKTGFVAKERPASHGHATCQQGFDRRIEPDDRDALCSQKFRSAGLRVSATAQGEHGWLAEFKSAAERGPQLRCFE